MKLPTLEEVKARWACMNPHVAMIFTAHAAMDVEVLLNRIRELETKESTVPSIDEVIVYCACDNGVDGMELAKVMYAEYNEERLKTLIAKDPNKAWRRIEKRIVNQSHAIQHAMKKLDGIDRLVLGFK